jgi:hypothetical protein
LCRPATIPITLSTPFELAGTRKPLPSSFAKTTSVLAFQHKDCDERRHDPRSSLRARSLQSQKVLLRPVGDLASLLTVAMELY